MISRHRGAVVGALGAALVSLVAVLQGSAWAGSTARSDISLADPAGDSGTALDITRVTISNTNDGFLTFTIPLPASQTLPLGHRVILAFDTDQNPKSGPAGAEYVLQIEGPTSYRLAHWNGSALARVSTNTVSLSYAAGATVRLSTADIGKPAGFNLIVETVEGATGSAGHFDLAPDTGAYSYRLAVVKPKLRKAVVLQNGKPKAGATFSVAVGLLIDVGTSTKQGPPTVLGCAARIAGKAIPVAVATATINQLVYKTCTMKLPSTSKGKPLVVALAYTSTIFTPTLRQTRTLRYTIG